jgi:hypothetical protein
MVVRFLGCQRLVFVCGAPVPQDRVSAGGGFQSAQCVECCRERRGPWPVAIDSGVDRCSADTTVPQELRHLEEAATIDTPAFDSGPTGARSLVKT